MNHGAQDKHYEGTKVYNKRMEQAHMPGSKHYGKEPGYFTVSRDVIDKIVQEKVSIEEALRKYTYVSTDEKNRCL